MKFSAPRKMKPPLTVTCGLNIARVASAWKPSARACSARPASLGRQVVPPDRQPLLHPVPHVAGEGGELLDVTPGRVEVPAGAEDADIGLGHGQLQVDRGPRLLGPLGVELSPGRVNGPRQPAPR